MPVGAETTMTAYESTTVQIPHHEFGTCALVQDLLPLYLEGEVSPGSRDTIVEHLARCERCASFLAGAQTVRAQLRRYQAQRSGVILHEQPARQAVSAGQRLAAVVMMLALCGLGAVSCLMIWGAFSVRASVLLVGGILIGAVALGGLAGLARRSGRLTLGRCLKLSASCFVGALAVIFLVGPHDPTAKLVGLVLGVVATAGIW